MIQCGTVKLAHPVHAVTSQTRQSTISTQILNRLRRSSRPHSAAVFYRYVSQYFTSPSAILTAGVDDAASDTHGTGVREAHCWRCIGCRQRPRAGRQEGATTRHRPSKQNIQTVSDRAPTFTATNRKRKRSCDYGAKQ